MAQPPLYKYLNVRGAKLTLGNRAFRHAKPSDFNDVEDMTIRSLFAEETEVALKQLSEGFTDVVLAHLHDSPTCSSPMREKLALIQQTYRDNPKAAELMKEKLAKEDAKPIYDVEYMRSRAEAHVKEINELMQGWRVLCVTTNNNSEAMWSEYAENHKGVVLRITPNVAKDSKFQLFQPVVYEERRPALYGDTMEFLAGGLFGDQTARIRAIMQKIVYAKTLEWRHESEYRLAIPLGKDQEPYDTLPYHPEEITEMYLGLAMEKADRDDIIALAVTVNPNISISCAKRDAEGAIQFERL